MIEFTKSYKTQDGQVFGSIEEAQIHELTAVVGNIVCSTATGPNSKEIAKHLLKNKDILIDVLTTTPNSKPKARSSHGGTKSRKPKTVVTDATTSVTSTNNGSDLCSGTYDS